MPVYRSAALATLLALAAAAPALAYGPRPIEGVQSRQRAAIEQGRWNGSITLREQRALIAEQERIDALRRQAKADGRITPAEKRAIAAAQPDARANIVHKSSNGQVNLWRRFKAKHGL